MKSTTCVLAILLTACEAGELATNVARKATPGTVRTETVHVRIDQAVLSGNDAFAVIEPVWDRANIYGSRSEYDESLRPFSKRQRWLFAVLWYLSEVNNGGHDQFYSNSTGIVWPDATEGFRQLDLPEFAAIVAESSRRMGGASREREERFRQMEKLRPTFGDLDTRLYGLEKKVDVDAKMLEFARQHPADK